MNEKEQCSLQIEEIAFPLCTRFYFGFILTVLYRPDAMVAYVSVHTVHGAAAGVARAAVSVDAQL